MTTRSSSGRGGSSGSGSGGGSRGSGGGGSVPRAGGAGGSTPRGNSGTGGGPGGGAGGSAPRGSGQGSAPRGSGGPSSSNSGQANRRSVTPGGTADRPWQVQAPGAERASSLHRTQGEAIARAREILVHDGGGELTVHGTDGRIRDSDTVAPGNDPSPPRDRR